MVTTGLYSDSSRMSMGKTRILCCLLLLLSAGCKSHHATDTAIPERHFAPLALTREVDEIGEYISDVEMVSLSPVNAPFSGISKLVVTDSCYYLVSGGAVFSISNDGENIQSIGRLGRGPGEYLSIKDITINPSGNELWCLDVTNRVLRFSCPKGDFIGQVDPGSGIGYARAVFPASNESFILYSPNPLDDGSSHKGYYCLTCYDFNLNVLEKKLEWEAFNADIGFTAPVTREGTLHILAPTSSSPAIVFHNGEEAEHLYFDFGTKGIPAGYFSKDIDQAWRKISDLFEADRYKFVSALYFPDGNVYFQAFGKESSVWNFFLDTKTGKGIRWSSIGGLLPPITALASDDGYLFFPYSDYGLVPAQEERDPLKKYIIERFGLPENKDANYIIKVKLHVE